LSVGARLGVTVRRWKHGENGLQLTFVSDDGNAERLVAELGDFGWEGSVKEDASGVWIYRGEKQP